MALAAMALAMSAPSFAHGVNRTGESAASQSRLRPTVNNRPPHYDAILAGGGAAGLSTAFHLCQALPGISLLIVDERARCRVDHSWCYWSRSPSHLDQLAYRTWDRLAIVGGTHTMVASLAPYRYHMLRTGDYCRFMHATLAGQPGVHFARASIDDIEDGPDKVTVHTDETHYTAAWVFDSRHPTALNLQASSRHHYLLQHFVGWEIATDEPVFDPCVPHLFDFRTPQQGAMRFLYVLPYAEDRGLVEYTVFSDSLLPAGSYATALRAFLETVLGAQTYRILRAERGVIPMTDRPFLRRQGSRVLNIGTRGGRVKPSSGFAFERIQQDAAAIARSLKAHGHPFDLPISPRRYRTFDAMLLRILQRRGELGQAIFLRLFMRNPIQRVFRFLDEEDTPWGNVKLMLTVPPLPFIRAWLSMVFEGLVQ